MVWLDRLKGIPLSRCSSHLLMCPVQWVTLYVTSKPTYIVWSTPDITHSMKHALHNMLFVHDMSWVARDKRDDVHGFFHNTGIH